MTTARDICTVALRKTGVVGTGQTAGAELINGALSDLNGMMGQWQVNRWLVYQLVDSYFTGSGAQTYTIGPTGTVVLTKRPDRLEGAYMVQLQPASPTPVSYPVALIQSYEDYARITLKKLSTFPWAIFYDPSVPNGTLYPWPIPTSQYQMHVLTKQVLQRFASLDDDVTLPDEYYEALIYNLCIRLNTSYPDMAMTPEVKQLAASSLASITAANFAIGLLKMPKAVVGSRGRQFNVYSGMND